MIDLCQKYNIILGHSTTYYPHGNRLAESSNKILMMVINKMLTKNKKYWHSYLKFALWANIINTKRSTGMSTFQLIYDIDVVIPINLDFLVMKLLKDNEEEPNDLTRRMNYLIKVQKKRAS
jgi:hypothetical protein